MEEEALTTAPAARETKDVVVARRERSELSTGSKRPAPSSGPD